MRKYFIPVIALLASTALAVPSFSQPQNAKNESFSKTVTFAQQLDVNGTKLDAGDYKVVVNGDNVTIEKGHKTLVQTQGRLEERPEKYETTQILFDTNGNVQEIRFGGRHDALILSPAPAQAGQQ
jgi:hypothetical protein